MPFISIQFLHIQSFSSNVIFNFYSAHVYIISPHLVSHVSQTSTDCMHTHSLFSVLLLDSYSFCSILMHSQSPNSLVPTVLYQLVSMYSEVPFNIWPLILSHLVFSHCLSPISVYSPLSPSSWPLIPYTS